MRRLVREALSRLPVNADRYPENDNLRDEYSSLFDDVPDDIDFARIALERSADAINLWIGNERSVTALHKDNYENVYVQVRGKKHFVLMPPMEMPCVAEQLLPKARYEPTSQQQVDIPSGFSALRSTDEELVPVATWDPDVPESRASEFSHLSRPLKVTLNEGDMLYLPAMVSQCGSELDEEIQSYVTVDLVTDSPQWYHKVSQTSGPEGFACAVNYWYDMDFDGSFWAANDFLRNIANARQREVRYPPLTTGDGQ